MIGNDPCRPRALGYGRSADDVVSLDVITGTGERRTLAGATTASSLPGLNDLVNAHLGTIRTEFGHFFRQVSGYGLSTCSPSAGSMCRLCSPAPRGRSASSPAPP